MTSGPDRLSESFVSCRENGDSWTVVKVTSSNYEIYYKVQHAPEIEIKFLTMDCAWALLLFYTFQLSTKNYRYNEELRYQHL